jgi:hypothetical protein
MGISISVLIVAGVVLVAFGFLILTGKQPRNHGAGIRTR